MAPSVVHNSSPRSVSLWAIPDKYLADSQTRRRDYVGYTGTKMVLLADAENPAFQWSSPEALVDTGLYVPIFRCRRFRRLG